MLEEHWNAVEADLQRFYGIHLGEAMYGPNPITARRLWALVSELPHRSATGRASNPDGFGWETEHELLAGLIEVVDGGFRNLFVATLSPHMKKPPQPWKAVTVPRPGRPAPQPDAPKKVQTMAEFRAAMMLKGGDDADSR